MKNSFLSTAAASLIIGASAGFAIARHLYYDPSTKTELEVLRKKYILKINEDKNRSLNSYIPNADPPLSVSLLNAKKESGINKIDQFSFGENPEYSTITMTYYSDKVLAYDDTDEIVMDLRNTVGEKIFDYLTEEDIVYIRNDTNKTYYEITCVDRNYDELTGNVGIGLDY